MSLIETGGAHFDGRSVDKSTATATMLDCINRLRCGKFDGVAQFLLSQLMRKRWGYSPGIQAAIDGFQGEKVDSLFLQGTQLFWKYGVDGNDREAFRMFSQGVQLEDPSGRCHQRLGVCHHYARGTQENMDTAIQLYRTAVKLGDAAAQVSLGSCFGKGKGVPKNVNEAKRLCLLAHRQGYVFGTFNLAINSGHNIPLQIALLKEVSARGYELATEMLQITRKKDPSSVISFGCWSPQRHVHKWVSDSMHREMAKRRPDGLVNTLPKLALMRICFFIACRPEEFLLPSAKTMQRAEESRRNWNLQRSVSAIAARVEIIDNAVQDIPQQLSAMQEQMNLLQQQMASIVETLKNNPGRTEIENQPHKRQKH